MLPLLQALNHPNLTKISSWHPLVLRSVQWLHAALSLHQVALILHQKNLFLAPPVFCSVQWQPRAAACCAEPAPKLPLLHALNHPIISNCLPGFPLCFAASSGSHEQLRAALSLLQMAAELLPLVRTEPPTHTILNACCIAMCCAASSGSHEQLRAALSLLQMAAELLPLQHAAVGDVVRRLRGLEPFLDFAASDPKARCSKPPRSLHMCCRRSNGVGALQIGNVCLAAQTLWS
jgi:hypothetical protein